MIARPARTTLVFTAATLAYGLVVQRRTSRRGEVAIALGTGSAALEGERDVERHEQTCLVAAVAETAGATDPSHAGNRTSTHGGRVLPMEAELSRARRTRETPATRRPAVGRR